MQSTASSLPELHDSGLYDIATPMRRTWNMVLSEFFLQTLIIFSMMDLSAITAL